MENLILLNPFVVGRYVSDKYLMSNMFHSASQHFPNLTIIHDTTTIHSEKSKHQM